MVQVLIHVRPADRPGEKCYELVDCGIDTSIKELKQKVEEIGSTSGRFSLHCNSQVTGFVINPEKPGKRFVEGRLVPYEQQQEHEHARS
ncbi:hypothetical protein WJX75_001067 [Coccomyxa subellipsoidea]|uniref:Uncharacterized protein n=1 Tax=Coccomyxa subellipsoidea TaxID=248742 RepID=A0ABR2YZD5_9CHLO